VSSWRPRLVALDIDGTLYDSSYDISPRVEAAVRSVANQGVHIVLSTGRGLVGTRPLAERLELPSPYLVCSNGAVTVRLTGAAEPEFVDVVTFDPEPVLRILLHRLPGVLVAVEEIGVGYRVTAPFPPNELSGDYVVEPIEKLMATPVTRVILRQPSSEAEEFLDVIDRVGLKDVSYYIGYTAWLDLAPNGVSKAHGLAKVADLLGVSHEDVLAIGDGNNDVEMLSWAGRGVAMGNAPADVQDSADDVTETIEEDGVALELGRWFDLS
jgi:hydroxymethylpyrimidine pyrophosphatase-like HAD family hydrolase